MSFDSSGGVLSRLGAGVLAGALMVSSILVPSFVEAQYATTPPGTVPAQPKKVPAERLEPIQTQMAIKAETSTKAVAAPPSKSGTTTPLLNPGPNPAAKAASKSLALLPISENSPPSGCGCFFYRPTDKRELGPLLLHMDGNGSATLRPEGQLVAMKLIDEQHSRRNPQTISAQDRVLLKMRGGTTNASLSGIAERNCAKNTANNACSSVSYQSILTIDHVGKKVSQPAWGFCGCR